MTGWRIGYGLAPESVIGAINKLQSHSTSNPTSIAQKAAVEALRGPQDSVPVMLAELRLDYPYLPIVVLSATHDRATVGAALAAGARGYVSKTASPDALLDAIRTVLGGARGVTVDIAHGGAQPTTFRSQGLGLTQRQSEVLQLLVQGKPNKLICRDLRLSEGTVKVHVSAILKALNVHSRSQAIVELTRRGVAVDPLAERR